MIVLNTTSDVVRVITASANSVDCHVTYVDNVASTPYLAARQNTAITTATTTTILGSPGASTQRQIKKLTIVAKGGGNTITIQLFDGTTAFLLFGNGIVIAVGETIEYEDVTGWRVTDANGQMKQTNLTPITLTGPVTGGPASGTIPTTVGANQITLPNLAQIATLTLLGNNTGGTANVLALTATQSKALLAIAFTDLSGSIAGTQLPAFTGDVTKPAGSTVTTLANIPTSTPAAGTIVFTQQAAPGPPSAGTTVVWGDNTTGHLRSRAPSGAFYSTAQSATATASQWLNSFTPATGAFTQTQPTFADISGTATVAQLPDVVIGIQTFAAGGTYTASAGVRSQLVEIVGAGGGGNGATAGAAGNIALGAGGGSGGYCKRRYSIAGGGTGTVGIGTAGTAGANTGAAAGTGGNSTFTDGTTLITANGGLGGQGTSGFGFIPSGTTTLVAPGAGFGGAVSTNGNVNGIGASGMPGHRISGTVAISGAGGSSFWAGGARPLIAQGNGNAGILGAGGSGGLSINGGGAVTGGAGGGGFCIITEYA